MKKFTKMDSIKKQKDSLDDILYDDDFFKIIKYEDYSFIKSNDIIVCIPFLIENNQMILRYEYIPSFKYDNGQEYHVNVISGYIKYGETPEQTLYREIEEKAGIVLRENYVIDEKLKPLYLDKICCSKVYMYILPLNEQDYTEISTYGKGMKSEIMSKSVKIDIKYINSIKSSDILTDYMIMNLKKYLNI